MMKEGEDEEERSRWLKNDRSRQSRDEACLNRTTTSMLAHFVPLRPVCAVWVVALGKRYIKVSQGLPLPPTLSPTYGANTTSFVIILISVELTNQLIMRLARVM
jgi:hypothetical protein